MASLLDLYRSVFGGEEDQAAPMAIQNRQGGFDPYRPAPSPDALQLLQDMTGATDLGQAYQAYQRGEYLPAFGQGAWGAAQAASTALPLAGGAMRAGGAVARGAAPVAREMASAIPAMLADERGAIRAYHYSPNDFTKFDPAKIGSSTDPGMMGRAVYFSTDPAVAKSGPHRYEVDLNVKTPLALEHAPDWRTSTKSDLAGEALGIPPPEAGMLALGKNSPTLTEWQKWSESIAEEARKRGHDAAVLDYSPAGYRHQEIAVYDPSIIEILRKYGIIGPVAAGGGLLGTGSEPPT